MSLSAAAERRSDEHYGMLTEEDVNVYYNDVCYRPMSFHGVKEADQPVLSRVLQVLYAINVEDDTMGTRSLTEILFHPVVDEYSISVRFPLTSRFTLPAIMAIWDASPTHVSGVFLGPWHRTAPTGEQIYANINVVLRSCSAPLPISFMLVSRAERRYRQSRLDTPLPLPSAPEADPTSSTTSSPSSTPQTPARAPWLSVSKHNRATVEAIVLLCKRMTRERPGFDFWEHVEVEDRPVGKRDRIVVHWHLPEGTVVDALAGLTLWQSNPSVVERVEFAIASAAAAAPHVVVAITLLNRSARWLEMIDSTVTTLYSSQYNRSADRIAVQVCSPSLGGPEADPVRTAEVALAKRNLERIPASKRRRSEEDPLEHESSMVTMVRKNEEDDDGDNDRSTHNRRRPSKRARVEPSTVAQSNGASSEDPTESSPFLGEPESLFSAAIKGFTSWFRVK